MLYVVACFFSIHVFDGIDNTFQSVNNANLKSKIKSFTPHTMSMLSKSSLPIDENFGEDSSGIIKFLSNNDFPFMAHIYPFYSFIHVGGQIKAECMFFTGLLSPVRWLLMHSQAKNGIATEMKTYVSICFEAYSSPNTHQSFQFALVSCYALVLVSIHLH